MTQQLPLFTPRRPKPPQPPTPWGALLDEVKLYATAPTVMNWWVLYRHRFDTSGQVQILASTLGGQVIQIGPYAYRDDADFIVSHLIEQGAPTTAVQAITWLTPEEYAAAAAAKRARRAAARHRPAPPRT